MVTRKILMLVLIVFLLGFAVFFSYNYLNAVNTLSYKTSIGQISIITTIPETPPNVILYRVIPQKNDTQYFSVNNLVDSRPNVTSEIEAPAIAEKILKRYGGLPKGARLTLVKTEYIEGYDLKTRQVTSKKPVSTNVQYTRSIDGIPVTGDGGFINIDLGNDGELLYLNKVWRTVQPAGTEKVISVTNAIEKLSRGEVLDPLKCYCDLNVDHIYMAYYEKGQGVPQEYLDPVWVFSGITSSGDTINYKVYARESDDLPRIPVSSLANIQANITTESQSTDRLSIDVESVNATVKSDITR